jgi:hypothetical protein
MSAVWIALGAVAMALAVVLFVINSKTMDDD